MVPGTIRPPGRANSVVRGSGGAPGRRSNAERAPRQGAGGAHGLGGGTSARGGGPGPGGGGRSLEEEEGLEKVREPEEAQGEGEDRPQEEGRG